MNNRNNIAAAAETATETTRYAYISEWMCVDQANDWIQCLLTDGYEVRVIAVGGIHPELEKAIVGYRKVGQISTKLTL